MTGGTSEMISAPRGRPQHQRVPVSAIPQRLDVIAPSTLKKAPLSTLRVSLRAISGDSPGLSPNAWNSARPGSIRRIEQSEILLRRPGAAATQSCGLSVLRGPRREPTHLLRNCLTLSCRSHPASGICVSSEAAGMSGFPARSLARILKCITHDPIFSTASLCSDLAASRGALRTLVQAPSRLGSIQRRPSPG